MNGRKSISGGAFYLVESLVAWLRKKIISISTIVEVKYIEIATFYTYMLWMKQNLQDMKVIFSEPINIKCKNKLK